MTTPTPEPLFGASGVKLFGRPVDGLSIDLSKAAGSLGGLLARLKPADGTAVTLARIYGFSYEGRYFQLARPVIYLVFGPGVPADTALATTGVATEPPAFAVGVTVWEADQADFSLRLELDVGPLERILIAGELGPGEEQLSYAGQKIRSTGGGADARLRFAGQKVQLRGD